MTTNWFGQIEEFVESLVTFGGKPITEPKKECPKCKHTIDLNREINEEGGVNLATRRSEMNRLGKWRRNGNKLEEKRVQGKLNLYEYMLEREQWLNQYYRFEEELTTFETIKQVLIVCHNCLIPLGRFSIKLRVTEPILQRNNDLTFEELYNLGLPDKILVKVAYNLGYSSSQVLLKWIENPDLGKAETLLKEFRNQFRLLQIPDYLADDFNQKLNNLIEDLPKEAKRRKQSVVEEVKKIAEADARVA